MSSQLPKYLRRAPAAEYIRNTIGIPCSARWLAKLAVEGGGPPFYKAGRFPMYAPTDLVAWAEGRIGKLQLSTADAMKQDLTPKASPASGIKGGWVVRGR
ncbi:MAG: hypothetical protein ABIQ30_04725 [Devosia sp.]